jgi:hypothetical protein
VQYPRVEDKFCLIKGTAVGQSTLLSILYLFMLLVPVYLIGDHNMANEEFHRHRVAGLGVGTNPDNYGWLVITNTRAGNEAYYKWLFTDVIVPWINELKKLYHEQAPVDVEAFLTMDGEPVQLTPMLHFCPRDFLFHSQKFPRVLKLKWKPMF